MVLLHIRQINGTAFPMHVPMGASVAQVKAAIAARVCDFALTHTLVLIHAGHAAPDDALLADLGVHHATSITAVRRDGLLLSLPVTTESDPSDAPGDVCEDARPHAHMDVHTLAAAAATLKKALVEHVNTTITSPHTKLVPPVALSSKAPLELAAMELGGVAREDAHTRVPERVYVEDVLGRSFTCDLRTAVDAAGAAAEHVQAQPALAALSDAAVQQLGVSAQAIIFAGSHGIRLLTDEDLVRTAVDGGVPRLQMLVNPRALTLDTPIATQAAYGMRATASAGSDSVMSRSSSGSAPWRLATRCSWCRVHGAVMEPRPLCPRCSECRSDVIPQRAGDASIRASSARPCGVASSRGENIVLLSGALPHPGSSLASGDIADAAAGLSVADYTWRSFTSLSVKCCSCGYSGPARVAFVCRAVRTPDGTGFPSERDALDALVSRDVITESTAPALAGGAPVLLPCLSTRFAAGGLLAADAPSCLDARVFREGPHMETALHSPFIQALYGRSSEYMHGLAERLLQFPIDLNEPDGAEAVLASARAMLCA